LSTGCRSFPLWERPYMGWAEPITDSLTTKPELSSLRRTRVREEAVNSPGKLPDILRFSSENLDGRESKLWMITKSHLELRIILAIATGQYFLSLNVVAIILYSNASIKKGNEKGVEEQLKDKD